MNRTPVTSSNVASVGYDVAAQVLEVEFKTGAVYAYDKVPSEVHDRLMAAESIGKAINAEVKPHFAYRKVN